ncbi:MAG: hypothetical protein ACI8XO_004832 [Verrucomicrobiales bacterium]|jgi:hypothetical protein
MNIRLLSLLTLLGIALSTNASRAENTVEAVSEPARQLVAVNGLGTLELIALLANPNELTRTRAHQELLHYLVVETDHPEHPDRLTRFHKSAPHACRANHEAQTLHILGLFAAQRDISSILLKQCLRSPHPRVRATALELAHFADNEINEVLLAFDPDPATLPSYRIALRKLDTPEAARRLRKIGAG